MWFATNIKCITLVNASDINVVSPAGLDLNDVLGTVVECKYGGANVFTSNWEFILGQPINSANDDTTIRFAMPKNSCEGMIQVIGIYIGNDA